MTTIPYNVPFAKFIGFQKTERPNVKFRLYNIELPGHRLNGSTVTVDTLVQNQIPVLDLSAAQLNAELENLRNYLAEEQTKEDLNHANP